MNIEMIQTSSKLGCNEMYPGQRLYSCVFSYDTATDVVTLTLHNSGPPAGEGIDDLTFLVRGAQLVAGLSEPTETRGGLTRVWPAWQEGTKSHPIGRHEVRFAFRDRFSGELHSFRFSRSLVRAWVKVTMPNALPQEERQAVSPWSNSAAVPGLSRLNAKSADEIVERASQLLKSND